MPSETTPHVQVLLATYNGARFLREQIDSILGQTYRNLSILARDDGSKDGTQSILSEYAALYPDRFRVMPESRPSGKAKLNFALLLAAATVSASAAPYVACSDQDDVWLPEKIERSMDAMHRLEARTEAGRPLLIFSDLTVVDEHLEIVHPSLWAMQHHRPERIHDFARLLTQNIVTGSTMVMNLALARLAVPMHPDAFMHDWWIALLACAFGDADFWRTPTAFYRQHLDNVLGAAGGGEAVRGLPKWRFHQQRRSQWEDSERQSSGFLAMWGDRAPRQILKLLQAYSRCERSPYRAVRVYTLLRHGFLLQDLRPNLAILLYLFDMDRAKRDFPVNPG